MTPTEKILRLAADLIDEYASTAGDYGMAHPATLHARESAFGAVSRAMQALQSEALQAGVRLGSYGAALRAASGAAAGRPAPGGSRRDRPAPVGQAGWIVG